MNKSRVLGIASHLPDALETKESLAEENPDWRVDDIYAKTGIRARRIAAEDETAGDLGYAAAKKLLERKVAPTEEIDYLLYCSQSPDQLLPSTACILQDRLGLGTHAGALDFNLGCSGYVYGLQLANSLVESGTARHVLLVTSDTYSKFIHPRDRTTRMLFGDGATATLIGPTENDLAGIGPFVVGTDGSGAADIIVPSGGSRLPRSRETAVVETDELGCSRSQDHLFVNGQGVFSFALNRVPTLIAALLDKAQLANNDVDWFVYHQANRFMLEQLAMLSDVPEDKMVYELEEVGNTVSSSIPFAIESYVNQGRIESGQRLMLVGFGVGLSWGACLMTWE